MRISDWSSDVCSSDLFFNFIAFLVFGLHVANTIGAGIINPDIVDAQVLFSALTGAIVWNVITWVLGIPSSSSHALIGGLLGAGLSKAGLATVEWSGVTKTVLAIVGSARKSTRLNSMQQD